MKITNQNELSNVFGEKKVYKLTLSALFIAMGTLTGSLFYIPFLGGKMFPVQHFLNVIGGVLLGPYYGVLNALSISLLRNIMGTGSILAFPGSVFGALLAGLFYKRFKNIYLSALGEVIGTGGVGAILAYPLATIVMGKEVAGLAFVFPFSLSCIGGAVLALILLNIPIIRGVINNKAKEF
ncbi:energy coupling factor transporter S component ThiW [Clostridium hydrogeniformans]|uniref:energy coupling factor transporter S component ThiW n=1 Tax=Clostridium hydrogeniformans TaxID=349933 RepID=UPI000553148B|nr:energy coupling factor transporter S component ThiW [Clostridium hydrogeniformans]